MLQWGGGKVSLNSRNNKKSFSKTRNSKQRITISTRENLEDEGRSEGKVFSLLMDFLRIRFSKSN